MGGDTEQLHPSPPSNASPVDTSGFNSSTNICGEFPSMNAFPGSSKQVLSSSCQNTFQAPSDDNTNFVAMDAWPGKVNNDKMSGQKIFQGHWPSSEITQNKRHASRLSGTDINEGWPPRADTAGTSEEMW